MLKLNMILLLILLSSILEGAAPQPIDVKTKVIRSLAWYEDQAQQWKQEMATQRSSPASWMNYYLASRYAQHPNDQLVHIANEMTAAVPGSFELLCVQAWQETDRAKALELLSQAYARQPDNAATYASLFLQNEFFGQEETRKSFSQKLFASGQLSQSLLHYSYNVLMSVEKDAVLFTEADHITVPIVVLQDVLGVRPDVKVLSLDLLLEPAYRERKFKDLSLTWSDGNLAARNSTEQKQQLCTALPTQNQHLKFYYTLTLGQENIAAIKNQLYVVGLASQLSTERLDNLAIIKENLENRFLLDYLTVNFDGEGESAAGKVLQTNYLVPMLLLHEHYQKTGDAKHARYWEGLLMKLATEAGKEALVNNFLEGRKPAPPFVLYPLNAKDVEDNFKFVKDNVYAADAEVTNEEYNRFLTYLQENKRTDIYEQSKFDLSQYQEPALSFMKGYGAPVMVSKKNRRAADHPAVNISYEGALAYCDWLTEQYNNAPGRKYQKVKFRLPTINEWQVAAASLRNAKSWVLNENTAEVKVFENGQDVSKKYETKVVSLADADIQYPWFRYYHMRNRVLNAHGCSLGNFKFPESVKPCQAKRMSTADGFWLMSPVRSYFPNDIGLFDVVGNVAEMTSEKGKACGGSWNHSPEESTIKSVNAYNGPGGDLGFRVFMEVLAK